MKNSAHHIRIVTYNIHKCCGLDRRVSPARIVEVLREIDADIIALQEVVCIANGAREFDQARFFAEELAYDYCLGENRQVRGGVYGNVILSRLPVRASRNYDISWRRWERRGCLRADIELTDNSLLHIFNVHLGLAFTERRHQARQLVGSEILMNTDLQGTRVVLGDFNEWTRGLASRLLAAHLESVDLRHHIGRTKTYPGVLPLLHLDHIYFDPALQLERFALHRSRTALVASDHVPLVADFLLEGEAVEEELTRSA
ncbi:MAG TPA: endonuclease/exonuclease/phosphatase family protein [Candidatus Binatia bacterium]|nr:endonuclease/exonuclease/phosphatase family protein [Candidatus Binatia bacterium]